MVQCRWRLDTLPRFAPWQIERTNLARMMTTQDAVGSYITRPSQGLS
jgi:hypothetical protein